MSRAKKLSADGRAAFTAAVLELLDEGIGIREINLRAVAKRVGCAHTNAYNYVASFEELLWWSLREALERMVGTTEPSTDNLIETYVAFALEHPAWYRLIWLDPLGGTPPPEVEQYLALPARVFAGWVAEHLVQAPHQNPTQATRVLHSYLHGELAAIVSDRVSGSKQELTERVHSGAQLLVQALFKKQTARRNV